jgi:hypothetical protein
VLVDVHHSDDDDTNLDIQPVGQSSIDLFTDLAGVPNANGLVDCEVSVTEDGDRRSKYQAWGSSLVGSEVVAKGVFVEDEGHDNKTELHPMDIIVAPVGASRLPTDWIGQLAGEPGLTVG